MRCEAQDAMTGITPTLKRSKATAAAAARNRATRSISELFWPFPSVGTAMCAMKNKAILAITPTTTAVMATSGAVKCALPWVDSTRASR
jgi:hypothetical protein